MGNLITQEEEETPLQTNEENPPEEDEPFNLSQIPSDLQYKIVEKLRYKEFAVLDRTSRIGHAVCWEKSYSLKHEVLQIVVNKKTLKLMPICENYYWDAPRIPWHLAARPPTQITADNVKFESRLSSGRIQAIAKLFEKNGTRSNTLELVHHITFEPMDLDRVIKTINAKLLDSTQFVPRQFFKVEAVMNLESLCLYSAGFADEELLGLKCDYLNAENDFVTSKGLNRFIKQWKKKQREIHSISIKFDTSFGTRNFDQILDGLEASMIWTPAMHEHSLVGKLKLEDFPPMQTGDPEHIYALFRTDDIENAMLLRLSMGRFDVLSRQGEAGFLMSFLNEDQYFLVQGKCYYCYEEFCEHRRRYSMERLKIFYPRMHFVIVSSYKAMAHFFGALRVEKVLMGERPFTRPPLFQYERMQQESEFSYIMCILRVLFFDHV